MRLRSSSSFLSITEADDHASERENRLPRARRHDAQERRERRVKLAFARSRTQLSLKRNEGLLVV